MTKTADDEDDARETTGGPEAWAPRLSAVAALLFALPFILGGTDFCLDDAWIHLSYAKSLRLAEGMSYNPGDWETGFSSPLWVLLLSVWPTGSDPVVPVKLLGALLHSATAWLAASVTLTLGRVRATVETPIPLLSVSLLSGILVAAQPTLLQGATSGMAVPLATALMLGLVLATLREATPYAAVLGGLAVLARPEALFFVAAFCLLLALVRRAARPLAGLIGALIGLGTWIAYCLALTGWAWPNTRYVKASGGGVDGLVYLLTEVLPWQPWLVGIGGLAAVTLALRAEYSNKPRQLELFAMLMAWGASMIAVSVTRPLHPGVLFFESRYFAIFAALPPVAIALGLAHARRWLAVVLVVPVAILCGLQSSGTHARQRDQERGIMLLHSDPARHIAGALPSKSVLVVEGAGAMRYFTPRDMTIVDALGLNDTAIAHATDSNAKVCEIIRRQPTHMALPEQIRANLDRVFEFEFMARFTDPEYAQSRVRHPQSLELLRVRGVSPKWRQRCGINGE